MNQNKMLDHVFIRLLRFIRHHYILIIGALIFIAILSTFAFGVYDRLFSEENSSDYISIEINSIQSYDPYYETKHFIPTPGKKGLQVLLTTETHSRYLETVGSPSCLFQIDFYKDKKFIGNIEIDTAKATKNVSQLPDNIVQNGYTRLLITPLRGSNYYISHLNFIDISEESVLFKEYPAIPKTMVYGTSNVGDPHLITGLIAYLNKFENQILEVTVGNIGTLPVELISISNIKTAEEIAFIQETLISPNESEIIYHKYLFDNIDNYFVDNPLNLYLKYKYTDDPEIHTIAIYPFLQRNDDVFNGTLIRETDNTDDFAFISKLGNKIYFIGNNISITKPLFLPPGMEIIITEGQTFDLINGAFILSRSPITAIGKADKPIAFVSSDGTGYGLAVLQAGGKSKFSYVTFDNLSNPKSGIWELTGAVTFYESDVEFENSQFYNNRSEDSLNIVRSGFLINKSHFYHTYGDAFDSDFSSGLIDNCSFELTGNDGLDISTSDVDVLNTTFVKIGDKGISAGENSVLSITNIKIDDAVIGIASKDISLISGDDIEISNIQIGFALYQKKPEFGPAEINVTNTSINGLIGLDYLIQSGSKLSLNGREVHPRSKEKEKVILDKLIAGEKISW